MKNILLYTDTPQIGGAELQMFLLAKFLNKQKFTPILACSNYPQLDQWCENFKKEGLQVIRLNVKHKHDPRHFTQIKKIIKNEKIDILHAHIWNPASCRYAFFAASASKIPVITTEHDPFRLSPIKNSFKQLVLKKTARIIAISKNNKELLAKLYPKHKSRIHLIHNGIDTIWWQSQLLRFTQSDLQRIKKDVFHAAPDTLMLITVAELHERKGLEYLIRAIPAIAEKFPNTKLAIVGDGKNGNSLLGLIKKLKISRHIILLGRRRNIPFLLKSSNIFILPSLREGFGLVNLEAMITPLPVVASNVGGIPDIVVDGKTGILVEPENSQMLGEAISYLISHPDKRQSLAKNAQDRVFEKFSAEKMAEEYEKVYKETLS